MNSESENVLKALSSSTRRTIMRQISEKGSATYSEIMRVLDLDPSLMSGKFNYHLKELHEVGLVERINSEYRITDLGKRALILVDQVTDDAKLDRYGVLSAVMSMSPRKELELFLSQMGMIVGLLISVLGIIPLALTYGTWGIEFWLSSIIEILALAFGLIAGAKMIGIVKKYKLGFSSFLFISSNWFFIRSPNRDNFFVINFLTIWFFTGTALGFLLPYIGEIVLFSLEWVGIIGSAMISGLLGTTFLIRAKRKAEQLEELGYEQ